MMTIELVRLFKRDDYTIGRLFIDGKVFCDTLEPSVASGIIIPKGEYTIKVTYSPKFRRMLPLIDVPGREGIRIHRGNTVKDTKGCVIVGYNTRKGVVTSSELCETRLVEMLEKENEIKIIVK
ncbi:MAG: DUF5675 family protein [Bacteroidales bacterium]|nr:DUF5675 family protein [Bacteroidales bacterium]